jgi:hypothetical protein
VEQCHVTFSTSPVDLKSSSCTAVRSSPWRRLFIFAILLYPHSLCSPWGTRPLYIRQVTCSCWVDILCSRWVNIFSLRCHVLAGLLCKCSAIMFMLGHRLPLAAMFSSPCYYFRRYINFAALDRRLKIFQEQSSAPLFHSSERFPTLVC